MDILYILVYISLAFSFGFLAIFFWAVDSNQMDSLDAVSWSILDDDLNNDNVQQEDLK